MDWKDWNYWLKWGLTYALVNFIVGITFLLVLLSINKLPLWTNSKGVIILSPFLLFPFCAMILFFIVGIAFAGVKYFYINMTVALISLFLIVFVLASTFFIGVLAGYLWKKNSLFFRILSVLSLIVLPLIVSFVALIPFVILMISIGFST
ncbi:MAG: hypothetical protein AABX73_02180 [Nanoarchaeota archaeon]